jgi:hypothetical protein
MSYTNYRVKVSDLSPAEQKELQKTFVEIYSSLSGDVKRELNKEARRSFKQVCELEWNNQTPALSQTLLQNGFKTKAEGTNLDRQIVRWKNKHLPYKTAFRLAKALKKPISDFFPSLEMFLLPQQNNAVLSEDYKNAKCHNGLAKEIVAHPHHTVTFPGLYLLKINHRNLLKIGRIIVPLIAIFLIWLLIGHSPEGDIYFPPRDAVVSPKIPVNGITKNVADDHYVWLVVEIEDLWWAKVNVPRNTKFSTFVREDGNPVDGKFTLSLFEVDEEWHNHFVAWLNGGKLLNRFPGGQKRIPESHKLDAVPLILQKK